MKTEKQTRQDIIDKQLLQAGWNVADTTQVIEEFEIDVARFSDTKTSDVATLTTMESGPDSPYKGHQYSDYVLLGRDGKPIAVVEAKKTSKDAANGREQVKQYCYNIQKEKGGELPFCFYTNGLEIYFRDIGNYPPRKVAGFPTFDDLERFQYIRRVKNTDRVVVACFAGMDSF